jgi:hypothetical protein
MSCCGEAFALFIPIFEPVTLAGGPDLQAVSVLDVHRVGERDENGMSEVTVIVHTGHQVTKRIPSDNVIQIKVTTRAQISKLQETAEEALRAKEKLLVQIQTLQDVLAAHRRTEAAHLYMFTEVEILGPLDGFNKRQESTGKNTDERLSDGGLPSQQAQAIVEAVTLPPPPPRVQQPETATSFDWQTWRLEVRTT